ncbi:MAG TPA: hypothetical protein VJN94_05055, partial [Candidatus Binataceae bacterium]|nr:hypothetical protein [Candidatus Binataceae bacterium]
MPIDRSRPAAAVRRLRGLDPESVPRLFSFDHRIIRAETQRRWANECVVPGFIDVQINGAFGIDVMSATAADLLEISRRLVLEGTTAWVPTVITSGLDRIERIDRVIAEAIAAQRESARAARAGSKLAPEAA